MSKYTQYNAIRPDTNSNMWETTEKLVFYERDDLIWKKVIVPAGFCFDWASIPRIFWIFYTPVSPDTINASCIHDYLWANQRWFFKSNCLFYKALITSWNSKFKSILFYLWVTNPIWYIIYLMK